MGTYYRHTKTETLELPYSFRCEQCSHDSGPQKATFTGEAYKNSNFKELTLSGEEKLRQAAHKDLVKKLKAAYRDATEKQVISLTFKDECPHCHEPQSWGVTGMKKTMFNTPIAIFIIGVAITLFCLVGRYLADDGYVTSDLEFLTYPVIGGIAAAGVLAALASLIWNVVKINGKVKKTSAGMVQNLPVIEWESVQKLLDED